jgi:phosphate transport system substrate-binding protein
MKKVKGAKRWIASLFMLMIVAISIAAVGCGGGSTTTITEAGSTTVQPLAEVLAAAFEAQNTDVNVVIQGGGTAVGIQSCNDGTVDLGAASRALKSTDPQLITHLIARDGIAMVTQTSNSLNGLTKQQVKDIFDGNITNWKDVGGADATIVVIAREEGSGTRTAFQDMVLGSNVSITRNAVLQLSNGAVKTAVSSTPNSIGFISFGYVDSSVKALAIDGVAATEANAKSGIYPIVRPLYFLTKTEPTGAVKDFLDYCTSAAGQSIVTQEGYISIQ